MASAILLERLRKALAPDYSVEMELASGGMGSVFLGHELALDRPVAIKLLHPELASADAAERFLTEARILAELHHPNVVPVFRVGPPDGLLYYVMEYLDGETLESRLRRGPLPLPLAYKVGRDLLDGLEAAHRHGVIHRDLKPANVMLLGRRALLTDFGIAIPAGRGQDLAITGPGVGTPGYMAPEQIVGDVITPRTDIYAAGAVLYEVFTGREWETHRGRWDGIPRAVARILERALAMAPEERWPDAATFRRALWQNRSRRYVHRTIALTLTALLLGGLGAPFLPWNRVDQRTRLDQLQVAVGPLRVVGGPGAPGYGDSVAASIRDELRAQPDFAVLDEGETGGAGPLLTITGRVEIDGATVRLRLSGTLDDGTPVPVTEGLTLAGGPTVAVADTAASLIIWAIWTIQSPIAPTIPRRALPRSTAGLVEFIAAERLVGRGRWEEAYKAYLNTLAMDPTCWLCAWRITDVGRWLGVDRDPALLKIALDHIDSFPPIYRSLVRAAAARSLAERIDTLENASLAEQGFFLPVVQLGDELFHRGPLIGRRRQEAVTALETAARLRPDYAPAWEHLLWARIVEGDSAGAEEARQALGGPEHVRDPFSRDLRALLQLGFAWRFLPPEMALGATQDALDDSALAADPNLGAGPRLLATFDAPEGAVAMGGQLAKSGHSHLVRSGTLAKLLGEVALGRLDSAATTARFYQARGLDPTAELFVAELSAMLWRFDPEAHPDSAALTDLARLAARGAAGPAERRRAEGMRRLLTGTSGATAVVLSAPFEILVRADRLARGNDRPGALALTDSLAVDPAIGVGDPFLRTAVHLLRAEWYEGLGNPDAARRELRWHENTDLVGYPIGAPQAGEVDWAFGTLGRWRRAAVLEPGDELCAVYRGVQRHWGAGDPPFVARADSARTRADQLGCPAHR